MKREKMFTFFKNPIFYTVVTILLLSITFLTIIRVIYSRAEQESLENLHFSTKQIKDDINIQMQSDYENLSTMASFAAKLYDDGGDYKLLFDAFNSIGLIKDIGILTEDGTFVTKAGQMDISDVVDFREEAKLDGYISGRVPDFTYPQREVIRSSVPVISGERTVAILYGLTELDSLKKRYKPTADEMNAQLYVFERKTGNSIIDTFNSELSTVETLSTRDFKKGYSYEEMVKNISSAQSGFSSFRSTVLNENLYLHYAPLAVSDWQIVLARPESIVFSDAKYIENVLFLMFIIMIIIMMLFVIAIYVNERKIGQLSHHASEIRRLLLEVTRHHGCIEQALGNIVKYANARSAMFVDSDGDVYDYIEEQYIDYAIWEDDRQELVSQLFDIICGDNEFFDSGVGIRFFRLNKGLRKDNPQLYKIFSEHNLKNVILTAITDTDKRISILATSNTVRMNSTCELMKKVIACFSIAIANKKHLNRTELVAGTDPLTGLGNRVAYNETVSRHNIENTPGLSCVYVDVNELHICNNRYGHAAGDVMLIFVANTLKEVFFGCDVYRIGGDEFLIFSRGMAEDEIRKKAEVVKEKTERMNYYVSIGVSFRTTVQNCDELVKKAESLMYEDKARYYQQKQTVAKELLAGKETGVHIKTGMQDLDRVLDIMSEEYKGIYSVALKTNFARCILSSTYLTSNETESDFKRIFTDYVNDNVNPDSHRALMNFLNYDVITKHLKDGVIPQITYTKTNGDVITLSVHPMEKTSEDIDESLWVFRIA